MKAIFFENLRFPVLKHTHKHPRRKKKKDLPWCSNVELRSMGFSTATTIVFLVLVLSEANSRTWMATWVALISLLLPVQTFLVCEAVRDHNHHLAKIPVTVALYQPTTIHQPMTPPERTSTKPPGGAYASAMMTAAEERTAEESAMERAPEDTARVHGALLRGIAVLRAEVADLRTHLGQPGKRARHAEEEEEAHEEERMPVLREGEDALWI